MNIPRSIAFVQVFAGAMAGFSQTVLINELQCGGAGPDRVELLNTGTRPVELNGLRFTLNERTAVLGKPWSLHAGERCVITFGRSASKDELHVGFGLPRKGGTLLVVSKDGLRILDVCTWPAMPDNASIGRQPDGGKGWSFFERSSFGEANSPLPALHAIAGAPKCDVGSGSVMLGTLVMLKGADADRIRYTTDGTEPTLENGIDGGTPTVIDRAMVIKARAFRKDALPSARLTATYFPTPLPRMAASMSVVSEQAWEGGPIGGTVEWFGAERGTEAQAVRVRESGSGSRSLPKRNLKIEVIGNGSLPWPTLKGGEEALLRADATPHAFLRNLFMERVAQRAGAHVDVQASEPLDLYLNGAFHGLYRLMPPKDEHWLRSVHGGEAMDILHGPSLRRIDGDRSHIHAAYEALLSGQPYDTLNALVDMESLIDLACFDLWTGRGDHDLNVRCWRPKVQGGRWRWILYDMDLWASAEDNSLARMCGEAAPVAPYLPQLLFEHTLRDRFLARMSALLATLLSPEQAQLLVNELFELNKEAMHRDHSRWSSGMEMPTPEDARTELLHFVSARSEHVLEQLSAKTGTRVRQIEVSASPLSGGTVEVEELTLRDLPTRIDGFIGVPMNFRAVPAAGYEFAGWKQLEGDAGISLDPKRSGRITAVFRRIGTSSNHGLQQAGEEHFAVRVP